MARLNPTLADGLWPWRRHLNEAATVVSTLVPDEAVRAAKALARELAREERVVVLTGIGASAPLFWHVPAGKELDTVEPDLVLLLVLNRFAASTRLLLATSRRVVLITGSRPEDRAESAKLMQMIVQQSSPDHVEVVVVADGVHAAREASSSLVSMASHRFGDRASWRHLSAQRVRDAAPAREEGQMASSKSRTLPLSEAELRAKEWEESFRRAEKLLQEAQETLRRQLERSAVVAQPASGAEEPSRTV